MDRRSNPGPADDKLLKQVVFGITEGQTEEEDQEEDGQIMWRMV